MKLIKKLVLTLSLVISIPLIIMLIHVSVFEYNSTKNEYFEAVSTSVLKINNAVSDYIAIATDTMLTHQVRRTLTETIHNMQYVEESQREINNMISNNSHIRNSILIDLGGNPVLSAKPINAFSADSTVMAKASKEKRPVVDFKFTSEDNKYLFAVYIPIVTIDDVISGYIVNFIDTAYINLIMQSATSSDVHDVYIVDTNNNVLTLSNVVYPLTELSTNSSKSLLAVFQSNSSWGTASSHRISFDSYDGIKKEGIVRKNPTYEFCIIYMFPSNVLDASTLSIAGIVAMYVAILIGLIVFIYFKYKHTFQKPFDEIFKTIQIYEMGDWTYRPVIMSNNELSMISDALWHMAEKMNSMYLDIKFNEYRYRLSLEFSNDILYDIDLTKNSIDSDPKKWEHFFGHKLGLTEKQVFGNLANSVHPEDRKYYEVQRGQLLRDCYDGIEKKCEMEFRILLNDGDYHWVLKKDILIKGATDNIEHIIGSIITIDEKKNIELKARVDSLTGLYNRAEFINRVNTIFQSGNYPEGAVIFFDIDDFKHINDNYGHDVGDDVLKFVGKSIIDSIDKIGIGGRYGGDELLAYVYSKEQAASIADEILGKLSKDFIVRGSHDTLRIQSSIGIAYFPDHETDAERLIKKADAAMYLVKKNGKNQYRIYSPGDEQTG